MAGLNVFRDEAGAFLNAIGKAEEDANIIVSMINKEIAELNASFSDESNLQHQVYDALFLLFELASRCDLDLDAEWQIGREKKQIKYIRSVVSGHPVPKPR